MIWSRSSHGIDDLDGDPVVMRAGRRGRRVTTETVPWGGIPDACLSGSGGVCSVALAVRESFTHLLDAPFSRAGKSRKVLPTLLDIQIPFPLDQCSYSFLDRGKREDGAGQVLAVGARWSEVRKRLETLAGHSLDPVVLDHEGLALWAEAGRERPVPAGSTALRVVLRLGQEQSTLAIGRGTLYFGSHAVRTNDTEHIMRLVRARLETLADATGGAAGAVPVEWLCAGAKARDPETLAGLRETVFGRWPGNVVVLSEPETFLARALAVRALGIGPLCCNLRGGEMIHPACRRQRIRRRRLAAMILLIGGVCLSAGAWIAGARLRAEITRVERAFGAEVEQLAGQPLGGAKGNHALQMAATHVDAQKATMEPYLQAFSRSLTQTIVDVMTVGKRSGLRFDTVSVDSEQVMIQGAAPSWQACDELAQMLRETGCPVVLDRHEAREDKWIPFTIR